MHQARGRRRPCSVTDLLKGRRLILAWLTVVSALCDSNFPVRVHPIDPARSETASRIPVDIRRFPWLRRLAADYAYAYADLAPFFAGHPADPAAWTDAIARAQAHDRDRTALTAVLAAQLDRRGAPSAAREAAGRLADPASVAIVTGQQAGLFGGPLYTLLKALTALQLANRVARDHAVAAVAVFWVDAEDHDWDEVRACTVLDEHLQPRVVSLPARAGAAASVGATRLDAGIASALDELAAGLAPTEFREALVEGLRAAYAPGAGMAGAFAQWLDATLGPHGLVVFDASDPAAKPLAAGVFARELEHPGDTSRLAAEAGDRLVAGGYHTQVQTQPGAAALFLIADDGARQALRAAGGHYTAGDRTYPTADLVARARRTPASFSPNVLLRPIVEDTIFPTACYVAGPSELAYFAQLKDVYRAFGVPMPLVHPRASATIADSAAVRFLTRHRVALEALQPQDEAALNDLLQAQMPPEVEAAFDAAAKGLDAGLARIVEVIPAIDPTLAGAAESTRGRMQKDLQTLHNKMIAAAKRRDETLRRQFTRAQALAFPGGEPQERAIGFVSFLDQYGPALVDRLAEELPLELGVHWIVAP